MKFVLSLIVTFFFLNALIGNCHGRWRRRREDKCTPCRPPCPKIWSSNVDPNDNNAVEKANLNLIKSLWNQPEPKLSCDAKKLKQAVISMAESCDPTWRRTALITTVWTWSLIPQISRNPGISSFAAIIDATLDFENCGCCKVIKKAIDLLALSLKDAGNLMVATTMKKAGCSYPDVELLLPHGCHDSTSHKGKELWKSLGCKYPCEFKDAALRLIRSDCYLDNLLGAIATASTTKTLELFFEYVGPTVASQLLGSQLAGVIPSHCCKDYQQQLDALSVQIPAIAANAVCYTKNGFGC